MELKSMALTPAEKKEETAEYKPQAPDYPWGLSLDLNDDSLEKLGIATLPQMGESFTMMAKVSVKSVSSSTYNGKTNRSCCLQITEMALGTDLEPSAAADKLYGNS